MTLRRRSIFAKTLALAFATLVSTVSAQSAAQGPAVVGIGEFPHGVRDIKAAVDFYQSKLGLELVKTSPATVDGTWEPNVYDKELQALMDVGGAYYRIATLAIPDSALQVQLLELVNNQDIFALREVRSASAVPFERGGIALRLVVPDIAKLTREIAASDTAEVLSLHEGLTTGDPRAVVAKDDDGFVIQMVRPTHDGPASAAEAGIVLVAANGLEKLRFYRDVLGFDLSTGEWEREKLHWLLLGQTAVDCGVALASFQVRMFRSRSWSSTVYQHGDSFQQRWVLRASAGCVS